MKFFESRRRKMRTAVKVTTSRKIMQSRKENKLKAGLDEREGSWGFSESK